MINGVWQKEAPEACCVGPSGAHADAADATDAEGSAGQVLSHSSVLEFQREHRQMKNSRQVNNNA